MYTVTEAWHGLSISERTLRRWVIALWGRRIERHKELFTELEMSLLREYGVQHASHAPETEKLRRETHKRRTK